MAQPVLLDTEVEAGTAKSLAELARETRDVYREFLLGYSVEKSSGEHVSTEKALAEYGRLNIWMEQTGATLRDRDSLDDMLQSDSILRDEIAGVFQQLKSQLSLARKLASKANSLGLTEDGDSDFTTDSDYSTDSQQAEGTRNERRRISKASLALLHAFESIGLLYHYSAILRRPRLEGRYLHSKSKQAAPNIPYYEFSHVRQKLEEWQQQENSPPPDFLPIEASPSEGISRDQQSHQLNLTPDRDVLCLRLAAANARRRDQLRYWDSHPFLSDQKPAKEDVVIDSAQSEVQSLAGVSESRTHGSNPTVHTFSSVARSAIFENVGTSGPARTTYADSTIGGGQLLKRIPNVPRESRDDARFECPFCHMSLDSSPMQDRNTWKRHVFRDLRPYSCTFARCTNPDKLYATRRDWTFHEMAVHRRQFNCRACSMAFHTGDEMVSHLKSAHAHDWDESQLHILLEVSEGPIDESKAQQCVFCSRSFPVKRLMEHIAGHLEELAVFVLPNELSRDLAAEESSGILSSLNTADDDISIEADIIDLVDATGSKPGNAASVDAALTSSDVERDNATSRSVEPLEYYTSENTAVSPRFSSAVQISPTLPEPPRPSGPNAYRCEECGRVFDQIHKLNHHKRYHERPHECPYPGCGKKFGTKTHLDRHINDKHIIQRKYHCLVSGCTYSKGGGKSFPRKDNWRRHMSRFHQSFTGDIPDEAIEDTPLLGK